jgi:hypothetical protein
MWKYDFTCEFKLNMWKQLFKNVPKNIDITYETSHLTCSFFKRQPSSQQASQTSSHPPTQPASQYSAIHPAFHRQRDEYASSLSSHCCPSGLVLLTVVNVSVHPRLCLADPCLDPCLANILHPRLRRINQAGPKKPAAGQPAGAPVSLNHLEPGHSTIPAGPVNEDCKQ